MNIKESLLSFDEMIMIEYKRMMQFKEYCNC